MGRQGQFTVRRLSALFLGLGAILFLITAGIPLADGSGRSVYLMPLPDQLAFILNNGALWVWTNALFIAASLLSLVGMLLLTEMLAEGGDHILARSGLMALSFAALLWISQVGFRISVAGWAHGDASNSAMIDLYIRLSGWVNILFIIFTILNLCGLMALGASVLITHLAPAWAGWTATAIALLGMITLLITGDLPPFVHYVAVLALGIALLLKTRTQSILREAC